MTRFLEWWDVWPGNGAANGYPNYTRKVNKKGCEEKWKTHKLDDCAAAIIEDTQKRRKFDKQWRENGGHFICSPLVYLNQRRWEDGGFADFRDDKKGNKATGEATAIPEVRRAVMGLIVKGWPEEVIARNFRITPQEYWDLERKVRKAEE